MAQGVAEQAVQVRGLWKAFGTTQVLRELEMSVRRGECLVLFGANGSGKTTLLRVLATLAKPDAGDVFVAGRDAAKEGVALRRLVGVLGHQTLLYEEMTAYENLKFYGRLYGVTDLDDRIRVELERVGMERFAHQRVRTLSHGTQKRISLARALLHQPRVLLLDEPEAGLDPAAIHLLERILQDTTDSNGAAIITTHNLERGLALGHRVAILARHRIVYQEEREAVDLPTFRGTFFHHTGVAL